MAKTKKQQNKGNLLLIGIAIALMFVFSSILSPKQITIEDEDEIKGAVYEWQNSYAVQADLADISYVENTKNTDYYDYNDEQITKIAEAIAEEASNSKEAMVLTLRYVYDNVEYTWTEPDSACFQRSAPEILDAGIGQCDTQSMVVISILRKLGVAAKPVGGCLLSNNNCALQSIFAINEPKYTELESVEGTENVFSRTSLNSRKGGLHAWVTAWDSEEGWLTLESTTGVIANTNCWDYHVELFVENEDKEDLCVSKNYDYAKGCQLNNFQALDENGIGLAPEASPQ